MNKDFKSGFVAIIGRPNVGKSTLLNHFLGLKLAIVSPKAQTTRNKIQGIYTTDKEQIIFVDTPGIHKAHNTLGEVMNEFAYLALDEPDVIIFMVDVSNPLGEGDQYVIDQFSKCKAPVIIALNKVDKVKDEEVLKANIESYKASYAYSGGITLSASNAFNIDKLKDMIIERLPNGPRYYPEDQLLDMPERFVVSELIREKILLLTKDEVPHSVAVTIDSFKPNKDNPQMTDIHATIVVERASQKKIIIGQGGQMIKKIGTEARKDIVKLLGSKVYLELFVKVEDDWRNKKNYLKEFGYNLDDYKK